MYAKLARDRADVVSNIKERELRDSLSRQMTRKWSPGDTYAPVDLSIYEMKKWKEPRKPTKDIIDIVGLNPLDHYKVSRRWYSGASIEVSNASSSSRAHFCALC